MNTAESVLSTRWCHGCCGRLQQSIGRQLQYKGASVLALRLRMIRNPRWRVILLTDVQNIESRLSLAVKAVATDEDKGMRHD